LVGRIQLHHALELFDRPVHVVQPLLEQLTELGVQRHLLGGVGGAGGLLE